MKKHLLDCKIKKAFCLARPKPNYLIWVLPNKMLLLWIAVLLASCAPDKLQQPLAEFQKDTKLAAVATAEYYNELNSFEQYLYLKELATNPNSTNKIIEFDVLDSSIKPIGLFQTPFKPKAIQARVALIKGLAAYADGLAKLAGTESDEQFKTNVGELATELTDLQATFGKLTAAEDPNASRYTGPLGTIAGVVGGQILKVKKDKALKDGILAGEAPINSLLDLLANDLKTYVETLRNTGNQSSIASLVSSYLTNAKNLSVEQRQNQLIEIKKTAVAYQFALDNSPSTTILKLKKVHEALVQVAKTPTPLTLGTLQAAIAAYKNQIQELVAAVKKFKN